MSDRVCSRLRRVPEPVSEPPARLENSTAVIVLGMHRSGTSALAGILHHLGVELGERLMDASADNPRGYWEHRDVVAVDQRLMTELGRAWDDIGPLPPGWENGAAAARAGCELTTILARDFAGMALWGLKDPPIDAAVGPSAATTESSTALCSRVAPSSGCRRLACCT